MTQKQIDERAKRDIQKAFTEYAGFSCPLKSIVILEAGGYEGQPYNSIYCRIGKLEFDWWINNDGVVTFDRSFE